MAVNHSLSVPHEASPARPRRVFGPYVIGLWASAFLAALLIKFSSMTAPRWNVEAAAWACALCYPYFVLARTAFIANFAALRPNDDAERVRAEASLAFTLAFRSIRSRVVVAFALMLALAAAADVALTMNGAARPAVGGGVLAVAFCAWVAIGPRLLVACGLWAREGAFDLKRAAALIEPHRSDVYRPWFLIVVGIAVASSMTYALLYDPMRAVVVAIIPNGRVVYFFSASFMAALIAIQLRIQSRYSLDTVETLLARERGETRSAPRWSTGASEAPVEPSSPATTVRGVTPSYVRSTRIFALMLLGVAALAFGLTHLNATKRVKLDAAVVSSEAACRVTWTETVEGARDRGRNRVMPCREAETFLAENGGLKRLRSTAGATLALRYRDPDGSDRSFNEFAPDRRAAAIVSAGRATVELTPERETPARLEVDFSFSGTAAAIFALFSGLVWLMPRIRNRVFGAPILAEDPPHPDEGLAPEIRRKLGRARKMMAASLIVLCCAFVAVVLARPGWFGVAQIAVIVLALSARSALAAYRRNLGADDPSFWGRALGPLRPPEP